MGQISPLGQARREARCGSSGKRRNGEARLAKSSSGRFPGLNDGLIWPTEGRVFAPAGRRYGPLVDGKSTAGPVPCQQTRNPGQTDPM